MRTTSSCITNTLRRQAGHRSATPPSSGYRERTKAKLFPGLFELSSNRGRPNLRRSPRNAIAHCWINLATHPGKSHGNDDEEHNEYGKQVTLGSTSRCWAPPGREAMPPEDTWRSRSCVLHRSMMTTSRALQPVTRRTSHVARQCDLRSITMPKRLLRPDRSAREAAPTTLLCHVEVRQPTMGRAPGLP
jgi:hypothetical protein